MEHLPNNQDLERNLATTTIVILKSRFIKILHPPFWYYMILYVKSYEVARRISFNVDIVFIEQSNKQVGKWLINKFEPAK